MTLYVVSFLVTPVEQEASQQHAKNYISFEKYTSPVMEKSSCLQTVKMFKITRPLCFSSFLFFHAYQHDRGCQE